MNHELPGNEGSRARLLSSCELVPCAKQRLTAEAQMGRLTKIILLSLLTMSDMIFSQSFCEEVNKDMRSLWNDKLLLQTVEGRMECPCINILYLFYKIIFSSHSLV